MAISLAKGQTINLKKAENDMSRVVIGLGWDIAEPAPPTGLLGKLFGRKQEPEEYDLDVVAFLLGDNGKVAQLGDKLVGGDVVFFNSKAHPSGKVWLTGDNRTGAGEGDDEQIICDLNTLDTRYQRIVFVVQIYNGRERNQTLASVRNAFIRAVDARGREMVRFSITNTPDMTGMCSLTFAEIQRINDGWKFAAIGSPHRGDSFVDLLQSYV